jgi:acyl dehydratase
LFTRTRLGLGLQGQLIAMLHLEWDFAEGLRIGDTVHVRANVVDRRETSKPHRGITFIRRRIINQDDAVVQEGTMTMLIKRRPVAQDT